MLRQNIHQMHRDHVPRVPPSFHLLGSTSVTKNQGMVKFYDSDERTPKPDVSQIHILSVQGHPEFTAAIIKEVIRVRKESGVLDKDTAESALACADERNDGVSIARVIWEVILQNPLRSGV